LCRSQVFSQPSCINPTASLGKKIKYIGAGTEEFVRKVIQARDPENKFKNVEAVRFPLKLWGPFFKMQGNEDAFGRNGIIVTVWTKKRRVEFKNFPKWGFKSVYLESEAYTISPQGIKIKRIDYPLDRIREKSKGGGLALKADVFEEFEGGPFFGMFAAPFHVFNEISGKRFGKVKRLTALEQMSFMSYALINYILFPNILTDAEKVQSVEKTGNYELEVIYNRNDFPTNSKTQIYLFDPKNLLLAKHFYRVSYLDDSVRAWHRTRSHVFADRIAFANRRRVRVSLTGVATSESAKAISGDFGTFEVFYRDPDGN
jgi:hypothetical protein